MKIQEIAIVDIIISQNRRKLSKAAVGSLMSSILDVGLLNPIGVTADMKLIHGRHRLEACRELGLKTIMATIHEVDDLHAELAEIDENLHRKQLSSVEECAALARRKQLWEEIHPTTKHGGDRKSGQKSSGQNGHLIEKSFADDTSMKTGRSSRSVRRDVEIGEAIPDDVVKKIAGTAIADNKSELKKLAKLDSDEQRVVADLLAEGEVTSVTEALKTHDEPEVAPAEPKAKRKGASRAVKKSAAPKISEAEIGYIINQLNEVITLLDQTACEMAEAIPGMRESVLRKWFELIEEIEGHTTHVWLPLDEAIRAIEEAREDAGGADE